MDALIAPLVLVLERVFGYPASVLARIGHPVMWIGALIGFCETRLNRPHWSSTQRRLAGVVALVFVLFCVLVVALALEDLASFLPFGWFWQTLIATTLLAQKELARAVRAVAEALRLNVSAAREAVSHVVGRDPQSLDQPGIARAAVETLAESTSDGVVAPWFFLLLFGLPGIALYKAVNTADSMIGHRNERYQDYGWAAAKLDDVLNWIPARLTALLVTAACFFVPGASPSHALATARRDANKHDSPNAGWPEAAFAGALGLQLGGPRAYQGEVVDLPAFGEGRADLVPSDIERALTLYQRTLDVLLGLSALIAVMGLAAWH